MGILFNSVKTYVEQVGRRRSVQHWNTLDSLECIFNGPTSTVELWIPKIGQSHPEYPSMTMDRSEVLRQAAGVTELRITYVGKLYGMGPIAIGSSTHWGESSWTTAAAYTTIYTTYQQNWVNGIETSTPVTKTLTSFVSYSYVCRYQIQTKTFKTIRKNPDDIIGETSGKVLSSSIWKSGQSFLSSGAGVVQSNLIFQNDMIDRQVNALNNGWYEISESWGPEPIIISSVTNI